MDEKYKICRENAYFLMGSGGLLGPSLTLPNTFWSILKNQTCDKSCSWGPKKTPRHIPDDPKKVQKNVEKSSNRMTNHD